MYRKPAHVAHARDGERTLVMHLESGALVGLSREATEIWDLTLTHGDPDVVVAELATRYAVDRARLRDDVLRLLTDLRTADLLEEDR